MIRFVGATTVTSGDRHTITTWISLAARLASVRAPQGRRMMALDPPSSEHGVLGSAGKASVFAKKASSVRSRCLYAERLGRPPRRPGEVTHAKRCEQRAKIEDLLFVSYLFLRRPQIQRAKGC